MELQNYDLPSLLVDTPVVLMNQSGATALKSNEKVFYVELDKAEDGLVTIRNTGDKWTCLTFTPNQPRCWFAHPDSAAKFQLKKSPMGGIAFVESSTGYALEVDVQRQPHGVICCDKYTRETQTWVLLQPHKLGPTNEVQTAAVRLQQAAANEDVLAGRRQLIMEFIELGKTTEEVKEILKILYGSTSANEASNASKAASFERRQQALRLLDCGKPVDEVRQILTLMYGTAPSEEKKPFTGMQLGPPPIGHVE